jgi:hypothetical protein
MFLKGRKAKPRFLGHLGERVTGRPLIERRVSEMWQICAGLYLVILVPIVVIFWTALVLAKRHEAHYADLDEALQNPPKRKRIRFHAPIHSVEV